MNLLHHTRALLLIPVLCLFALVACNTTEKEEWTQLFNGVDLSGWHVKITGYAMDDNFGNTFVVEDGLLKVQYAAYDSFDYKFGHLFYKEPFENYHLRIEYRFTGEQIPGGPEWALRNSGVMFHAQSPGSMGLKQDFPICLEAQFLGGNGSEERPTMNLCTPGTHVEINGELVTDHCINSSSDTYHGDQWVLAEVIVTPEGITHLAQGDTVLQYAQPIIGGGNVSEFDPKVKMDNQKLTSGYIALQSESHPIEFRSVEIRRLDH